MQLLRNPLLGLAWLLILIMLNVQTLDAASDAIQYRVNFREAANHRVDIELSTTTGSKSEIELMMPVWTPGSYLVREYARQVEQISASDGSTNQPLSIRKKDKNHWVVNCDGANEVVIRYTIYCREMSVRTNWVETDFAFLTGAATFLTRTDRLQHPHHVRIDALPNWSSIATSLKPTNPRDPWSRTAKNFDELVDSPIAIGNIDIKSFEVGGALHHLATLGGDSFWDTAVAVNDVAKIVEHEQKFWNVTPYQEYWFLNLVTESGGGLEHDNSCVLMTGRWTQRQKSKYQDWLGLVSHEFFHTWNVRRLRPKALQEYDYNQEQYLQELWIAEGITSYYDDLFVVRTGLIKPKEYLDRLSKGLSSVQNGPGRLTQSLHDSSFDAWTKFYRPDENANNSRVSYYTKGALVGLLLDIEIRSRTNSKKSLDDVMRMLWTNHANSGYTNEDFAKIVETVCGQSVEGWLEKALATTEDLDFSKLMTFYGLDWKPRESDKDGGAGNKTPFGNVYVGMDLKQDQGKTIVDKVSRGSPAAIAGIQSGDELLGFDGYRVSNENWNERLNVYRPGEVRTCLVSRRGKLVEVSIKLSAMPDKLWTLVRSAEPTEEQEMAWNSWLHLNPEE
jgi:predicted metalloprotease with PDZ domain